MSDDLTPPDTLPSAVEVRKVRLAWVPEGLSPRASFRGFKKRDGLAEAVHEALRDYAEKRQEKRLPWLRAGTGAGSVVLNYQGILLLSAVLPKAIA